MHNERHNYEKQYKHVAVESREQKKIGHIQSKEDNDDHMRFVKATEISIMFQIDQLRDRSEKYIQCPRLCYILYMFTKEMVLRGKDQEMANGTSTGSVWMEQPFILLNGQREDFEEVQGNAKIWIVKKASAFSESGHLRFPLLAPNVPMLGVTSEASCGL